MLRTESNSMWFYQHRQRVLGPVNSDELRFLALTGKVKPDTLIRPEASEEWIEYSTSSAAFVPLANDSPSTTEADASPGERTVAEFKPAPMDVAASDSVLPEMTEVADEERGLRIVSVAAVLALILLAVLLNSLWRQDPKSNKVADHGSSGHEGSSRDNLDASAGGAPSGKTGAAEVPVDAPEESLNTQKTDENLVSADVPAEVLSAAAAPVDEPQADESAMADEEAAVVEDDAGTTPDQGAASERDPDRFGVALAPKVAAKSREKSTKPKASRTALQPSNLSARSGEGRQQAIEDSGGTVESESAVALALEWLRRIQRSDGSWDFQAVGEDAEPGSLHSPLGATAMATLCFLGSGSTTRTGPDQELVKRAFEFMISQKGTQVQGSDSMYVHALVTLCLTELVTMEAEEKKFRRHAIDAVSYIEQAQDPVGGGWRYTFQSPGDTSVTGWDVMALQSGQSGRIKVNPAVVSAAQGFLDSVSDSGGATYAYTPGSPATPSMTAVGLLCRMYLGWAHESQPLREGIHRLSTIGVSQADMYYNYYATIALHHYGGTEWSEWNAKMRDQLVTTQITQGEAAGSWQVTDPHGGAGGQIYQTCLSVLTLEVYYRYLPLYHP